jgi:hypothetical protein
VTHRQMIAAAFGLCCLVMAGCAEEATTTKPALPPTPFDTAAAKAEEATKAADEAAKETPVAKPAEKTPPKPVAAYEAPFPDRTDLFEPRKHAARVARLTTGDSADSVVLMGFAKLDVPRVVLAINGEVKPLRTGEEALGIQVISIEPPRAVLQRGRSRWTASIE